MPKYFHIEESQRMSVGSRFLILVAAIFLPGAANAAVTPAAAGPNTRSLGLQAGLQATYVTSVSLTIDGDFNKQDQSELVTVYTVLKAPGNSQTVFAATDKKSRQDGSEKGGNSTKSSRFTFELTDDGAISDRMAGFSQPVFDGWTPNVNFPMLLPDGVSTKSISLPLNHEQVDASVTSVNPNGGTGSIIVAYKSSAVPGNDPGLTVNSYEAVYNFDSANALPASSKIKVRAIAKDMTGKEGHVALDFDSHRTKSSTLPPKEFEEFQKDVAAGVPVAEQLSDLLSGGEEGTSKALDLMSGYSKSFPKGVFGETLSEIQKSITMMAELQNNWSKIKEGAKAPAFQAKTIDGETVKLADLRGKVVLLDFWATWCGPCRLELPNVKKVYEDAKDAGFTIVGISADNDEKALRDVIKSEGIPWKQIREGEPVAGTVMSLYGVMKFPTTILIDREGTIRLVDAREEELASAVAELVKETH
jgi:peroxiredoxin